MNCKVFCAKCWECILQGSAVKSKSSRSHFTKYQYSMVITEDLIEWIARSLLSVESASCRGVLWRASLLDHILPSISIQFESINKHVAECKCWEDLSWQGVKTSCIESACESEPCGASGGAKAICTPSILSQTSLYPWLSRSCSEGSSSSQQNNWEQQLQTEREED